MLPLVLLLAACPALPQVPERAAVHRAADQAAKLCAGGARKEESKPKGDEVRDRVRQVSIRVSGKAREITFRDEHHRVGVGDASGSATEQVVFLEVDGALRAVETSVEVRSETGPFLFSTLACVVDTTGAKSCTARTNHDKTDEPGPEVTSCGASAEKQLPTLAGVQKRYGLCPELLPAAETK